MSNRKEIDAALIERVKKGDTSAFRQLVDEYKDVSLSLAYSVLRDREKSEDVLQEVFMKVFHKAKSFRHQSSFSSWLYRIVVNTSLNEAKRSKTNLSLDTSEISELEGFENSGFERLKEKDRKKYILTALDMLRPDESLVLRLFYLCEMSIREIEEITSFNQSKIKVDLHRGRHNFEKALVQLLGNQLSDLL